MEKERKIKSMSLVALIVAVLGLTVAFAAMSRTLTINGTATMDTATWDIHFEGVDGFSSTESNVTTLTGKIDTSVNQQNAAEVTTSPTIQAYDGHAATKIGNYAVKLTKPGDTVQFVFDVVNSGTINADLTSVSMPAPTCSDGTNTATMQTYAEPANDAQIVCDKLVYTLQYATVSGTTITAGDTVQDKTADTAASKTNYQLNKATVSNNVSTPTHKTMVLTIGYNSNATTLPSDDVTITGMDITLLYSQR